MKRGGQKFVYFIRPVGALGPVKIGCSELPLSRLKQLAAWSPVALEVVASIPGDFAVERSVHEALADLHSHKEWFSADPRIDALIDKLNAGTPLGEAVDLTPKGFAQSRKAQHYARNPEARLRCSYAHRMSWADRKRHDAGLRWYAGPAQEIMERWQGRTAPEKRPTEAEFAVLEAYLAAPLDYRVELARAA